MTKQNYKTGFLVAAMVFSAIALRVLGKFDILKVPGGIVPFPLVKDIVGYLKMCHSILPIKR